MRSTKHSRARTTSVSKRQQSELREALIEAARLDPRQASLFGKGHEEELDVKRRSTDLRRVLSARKRD